MTDHAATPSAINVLICDLVGLRPGADGRPDCSEVREHIEHRGGVFHEGPLQPGGSGPKSGIHFYYCPDLNTRDEFLEHAADGRYHAVIAAATAVPAETAFTLGGVRIGAGTGNMQSRSWGGPAGSGGGAPLMNTPGINSRATAQMVFKALLRFAPELPFDQLHALSVAGEFDTGRDLPRFPASKLEGRRFAVLGYGNIGRDVARIARSFGMDVVIYARARHRDSIEAQGFEFAATSVAAARDAHILSVHLGLGAPDPETGRFSNAGLVSDAVLDALANEAIIINFDRGELVDTGALDRAMERGQVRHAAIDADIFCNRSDGTLSGPLAPYLPLEKKYGERLLLLPHAAADTDHPSRVAGARQAVDQILDAINHRLVSNLRGDLPAGYASGAVRDVTGVSAVTWQALSAAASDPERLQTLAGTAAAMAAFWQALADAPGVAEREALCREQGEGLLLASDRHATLLRQAGLHGPFARQEG